MSERHENDPDQPIKVNAKTAEALPLAYPLQLALNRWLRGHMRERPDRLMIQAVLNRCDDQECPCQNYDVERP